MDKFVLWKETNFWSLCNPQEIIMVHFTFFTIANLIYLFELFARCNQDKIVKYPAYISVKD